MSAQALRFGLKTRNGEVAGLDVGDRLKRIHLADGSLSARTLVIASGASPNKLGVKGEAELTGKGVSYCAVCDAPFFRDQEVAVVGGGDTAVEEALYLTKFARRVHLIHRRDRLRATQVIQEAAVRSDRITLHYSTVVTEIRGGSSGVEGLGLCGAADGKPAELSVTGVFVFVGIQPNTAFVPAEVRRDPLGFIQTDQEMRTSIPGVLAAGDVRAKSLRQIVTAVGDGAIAAFTAGRYIEGELH